MSKISAVCQSCNSNFMAEPRRTFLGFQKLKCTFCGIEATYPLTRAYRITYWVIFGVMVAIIINSFAEGQIGFPGGIGIAVLVALVLDWRLKRQMTFARAKKAPGQV